MTGMLGAVLRLRDVLEYRRVYTERSMRTYNLCSEMRVCPESAGMTKLDEALTNVLTNRLTNFCQSYQSLQSQWAVSLGIRLGMDRLES
jgi:hypothetical protein